jgi:hypothetical protein
MNKQKQAAIETISRHFSATWEKGEDPPDAYLMIARKRIAVEVAILKPRPAVRDGVSKPRLRFDRVALGLVRRLQAALSEAVPENKTVIVTVTAPIWQASKTASALEDIIRGCLARRRPAQTRLVEAKDSIHENQIRVRLVEGGSKRASKVVGFVHNPDSDPEVLLDMTQSLIEGLAMKSAGPARAAGDRWLVLAGEDLPSHIETYRQIYAALAIPTRFTRILLLLARGRIETLAG